MSFIEDIKTRAKENIKTIVLPEANDKRGLGTFGFDTGRAEDFRGEPDC